MLNYQLIQEQITRLFDDVPNCKRQGYSIAFFSDSAVMDWFNTLLKLSKSGDNHLQEYILEKLIFLYPVFQKSNNAYHRIFCTLTLKYYQAIPKPGKRIQAVMTGAYKKMLKWEVTQSREKVLSHHYTFILNEYLEYLEYLDFPDGEGAIPPYLDFEVKHITNTTSHQRLYLENQQLRRELYCDLWHPSNSTTTIMLYHITGYSSRTEQQKRRHTYPDNFTRYYLKLVEQFPDECISLCVIPCPYEDVYKAFLKHFSLFLKKELFPVVEQVCDYQQSGMRGISAYSKGGLYTYSLIWEESVIDAVVTHSGAQLEIFVERLNNRELPVEGISIMVTCGSEDSFYQNNKSFIQALHQTKIRSGSYLYSGTHNWQDVEPIFFKGLRWLVKQLSDS